MTITVSTLNTAQHVDDFLCLLGKYFAECADPEYAGEDSAFMLDLPGLLSLDQNDGFVAYADQNPVGIILLEGTEARKLFVLPTHRRQGIASLLLEALVGSYTGQDSDIPLWLYVRRDNDNAHAFYQQFGFVDTPNSAYPTYQTMEFVQIAKHINPTKVLFTTARAFDHLPTHKRGQETAEPRW